MNLNCRKRLVGRWLAAWLVVYAFAAAAYEIPIGVQRHTQTLLVPNDPSESAALKAAIGRYPRHNAKLMAHVDGQEIIRWLDTERTIADEAGVIYLKSQNPQDLGSFSKRGLRGHEVVIRFQDPKALPQPTTSAFAAQADAERIAIVRKVADGYLPPDDRAIALAAAAAPGKIHRGERHNLPDKTALLAAVNRRPARYAADPRLQQLARNTRTAVAPAIAETDLADQPDSATLPIRLHRPDGVRERLVPLARLAAKSRPVIADRTYVTGPRYADRLAQSYAGFHLPHETNPGIDLRDLANPIANQPCRIEAVCADGRSKVYGPNDEVFLLLPENPVDDPLFIISAMAVDANGEPANTGRLSLFGVKYLNILEVK